jgi:hypothetical protein
MKRYALIKNGVITEGPIFLPKNWENISGLDLLDDNQLKALGWLPWRFVEINAEIITGTIVEIYDTEIVETQTGRNRTDEDIQESLINLRKNMSVTPLQIRRALRKKDLLNDIMTYINSSSEEIIEAWEYAIQIDRMNPLIIEASNILGISDDTLDDIFVLASKL